MKRTFKTESELTAFAADFGRTLRAGDAVGFSGPLGSGKTTFVRAVVKALGGGEATSPTFTFWHRYAATPPVDHLDLYRVDDPREIVELGLEEAFGGDSIALVEWWEHAPDLMPARRYLVTLAGAGDEPRDLDLQTPR